MDITRCMKEIEKVIKSHIELSEMPWLRPCPFCGNDASMKYMNPPGNTEQSYHVECKECQARTTNCYEKTYAARNWNSRIS